jgi:exopolysaccharide biosynthesis polyprenyl glycosylphosphotransferase
MTPSLVTRLTVHEAELAGAYTAGDVFGEALDRPGRREQAARRPRRLGITVGRSAVRRRTLALADMVATVLGLTAALMLTGGHPGASVVLIAPLTVILFKVAGLYDREELRLTSSTFDDTPLIAQLAALMTVGTGVALGVAGGATFAGTDLALLWVILVLALTAGRITGRRVASAIAPSERCLVLGPADGIARVTDKIRSSSVHATVVATMPVADDEIADAASVVTVRRIARDLRLDRLIIAPGGTGGQGVGDWIRVAKAIGLPVSVQPRVLDVVGSSFEYEDVNGMSLLGVRSFGLSRSSRAVKRTFDVTATGVGLIVAAPLMALIAVAIRLDSRGPVFYRQTRVGRDGRHFAIWKFRSMVVDAHAQRESLRSRNEAGDGLFKITSDPRVTRVGRMLRSTSLDELPQLLNVLRGEMSLVGPRPLVIDEDAQVLGLDRSRLHLTPGMTGPWQVLDSRVPMPEMVALDYLYVANWTLWLDLALLVRTVRHVARGGNL